tara:strand:+ start:2692 stop:4134 length:1443 start_codon:yes stop_codon:yes gene_type:complete
MSNGTTGTDGYDYSGISSESIDDLINDIASGGTGGGLGSFLSGLLSDNFADIAGGLGGMTAINAAYNRLGGIGDTALSGANIIADRGLTQSEFVPFTVTTGMGGSASVNPSAINILSGQGDTVGSTLLGNAASRFATPVPEAANRLMGAGQAVLESGQSQIGQTPALGADLQGASSALLSTGQSDLMRSPFGLGGQQRAADQAFNVGGSFMGQALAPTQGREQEIFGRIRAMQTPEEKRQRLALEERLFNQGRLGVRTAMFGGTPEQLALAKAQEEAQDRAALAAMQQAQQEQRQQAAIGAQFAGLGSNIATQRQALEGAQQAMAQRALQGGSAIAAQEQALRSAQQLQALQALQAGQNLMTGQMGLQEAQQRLGLGALTGAFVPQAQTLNALQQGLAASQLAQRGQLYGAGLFGEASMGGLEALLGAGLGQANLMGNVGTGLLAGALGGSNSQDGLLSIIGNTGGNLIGDLLGTLGLGG